MTTRHDVLVLGAGNAGMAAARVAREHGRNVAIVDHRPVGGTCPLRGCVPKKVMVVAAEALQTIEDAHVHRIDVAKPKLAWNELVERVQSFTEGVSDSFTRGLRERGIALYEGRARFTGANAVDIDGQAVEAGAIVIATGSTPRQLPFPGSEHLVTNEEILTRRDRPESVVFIGGGVIGMEFAHVYARAGSRVTILEAAPRLLTTMEDEVVQVLRKESERIGIAVSTGVEVQEIAKTDDGFEVRFVQDGEARTLACDQVAHGAGRVPDVLGLDLDAANIAHDGARLELDDHLRSVSNPSVHAAGDAVADSAQLSPLATHEGQVVGHNIVHGPSRTPDYLPVPAVVYTVPGLASVGLTEAAARDGGMACEAKSTDMSGFLSARIHGHHAAYAKVVWERDSGGILGAHLLGPRAEEMIHVFALAMKHGITRGDLASLVSAFPTFSSEIRSVV